MKEDKLPSKDILEDYVSFNLWREEYFKKKEDKKEKPTHGW